MTSLIIPTHNRSSYLRRLLDFLKHQHTNIPIIIADSSSEAQHYEGNVNAISLASCNLIIEHLDYRGRSIHEKLVDVLKNVETSTVCLCGDDDFIVPDQIEACGYFLEQNQKFSHAHGKIWQFEKVLSHRWSMVFRQYPQYANVEEDAAGRLKNHFLNYTTTWYSIHRTKLLLKNFELIHTLDIGRGLKERLLSALDLLDGKRKMFDVLFMVRQKGQTLIDEDGTPTLPDAKLKGEAYVKALTKGYSDYEKIIVDQLKDNHAATTVKETLRFDFEVWSNRRLGNVLQNKLHRHWAWRFASFTKQLSLSFRDRLSLDKEDRKILQHISRCV